MSQDKQGLAPFKALLVLFLSHVPLGLTVGSMLLTVVLMSCSGIAVCIVSLVKEVEHEGMSRPW